MPFHPRRVARTWETKLPGPTPSVTNIIETQPLADVDEPLIGDHLQVRENRKTVIGNHCRIHGNDCFVQGHDNVVYGKRATVIGNNNTVPDDYEMLSGSNNTVVTRQEPSRRRPRSQSPRRSIVGQERRRSRERTTSSREEKKRRHEVGVQVQGSRTEVKRSGRRDHRVLVGGGGGSETDLSLPLVSVPASSPFPGTYIGMASFLLNNVFMPERDAGPVDMFAQLMGGGLSDRPMGGWTPLPRPSAQHRVKGYETLAERVATEAKPSAVPKENLCLTCLERVANVVFLPCSHQCMCCNCTAKLMATNDQQGHDAYPCPMCRKNIDQVIPIRLAGTTM